jgi:hypothetical protein
MHKHAKQEQRHVDRHVAYAPEGWYVGWGDHGELLAHFAEHRVDGGAIVGHVAERRIGEFEIGVRGRGRTGDVEVAWTGIATEAGEARRIADEWIAAARVAKVAA